MLTRRGAFRQRGMDLPKIQTSKQADLISVFWTETQPNKEPTADPAYN